MNARTLVAGFDPFGGERLNASAEVVGALRARHGDDPGMAFRVLPTDFVEAPRMLEEAVREVRPGLVVCLGQARGRAAVTPERVAVNVADARSTPDNAGRLPSDEPVVGGGPVAYRSTLPVRGIEARLREEGIPARVSETAGTFVCNAVFYRLMRLLETEFPATRGGFLHVPVLPEQAADGETPSMALGEIVRAVGLTLEVCASLESRTPRAPARTSRAPRR